MSVDYDQFLKEDSRAILLAGLPPKVPQTELMSWLSGHGLKPKRLQAVQNSSSESSTEDFQVIFPSHSEARHALDLKLSEFGDHKIEVRPSSYPSSEVCKITISTEPKPEKTSKPSIPLSPVYRHSKPSHSNGNGSQSNRTNNSGTHDMLYPYQSRSQPSQQRSSSRRYNGNSSNSGYSREHHPPSSDRHHMHPPITKVVPGDWVCPVQNCSTYNYAFRLSCYKCNCVKPPPSQYGSGHNSGPRHHSSYHSKHPPSYRSPYPPPNRSGSHGSRPGDWLCPNRNCGFQNFASRVACLRCGTENPLYEVAPQSAPNPVPLSSTGFRQGDWICPGCKSHNFASRYACMRCSGPRPSSGHMNHGPGNANGGSQPLLAGDWLCRHNNCGFHNFAKRHVCGRCGAPSNY